MRDPSLCTMDKGQDSSSTAAQETLLRDLCPWSGFRESGHVWFVGALQMNFSIVSFPKAMTDHFQCVSRVLLKLEVVDPLCVSSLSHM